MTDLGMFQGKAVLHHLRPWEYSRPWTYENIQKPSEDKFDGRHAVLLCDIWYIDALGHAHIAHRGLVTDGGTIRTPAGWLTLSTPFRDYLECYLIHDQECKQAKALFIMGDEEEGKAARKAADKTFREMLRARGVGAVRACAGYRMVRVGAKISGM